MDDEVDTGAYNPDLVEQQDYSPPPPDDVPAPPPDEDVAQSAPPEDAGYTSEEPTTDGSGGQPADDNAPPVSEDEDSTRKNGTSLVRRALDALREQFGLGGGKEPSEDEVVGPQQPSASFDRPTGTAGGMRTRPQQPTQVGPDAEPTVPGQAYKDQVAGLGKAWEHLYADRPPGDATPGQPDEVPGQPSPMAAQPPVPYTGQPGQPDAVPGQLAPNPPQPMQYLNGKGAEDNATRTARENEVASRMPPGTDMNTVRSQALNENIAKNGPEAAGAQLQNHRDQYNKFKAMAAAALDHGDVAGAASLYNDAHTFMPDGHKVTASPGANGGMNLNIQDLTGGKPSRDIQLTEDQFRELTHMRAGEFDHVFERGIDKNAADLARTPGMPRGTFDQAGGAQPGVAKQFNEPFQGQADRNQADIDQASKLPRLEDLERQYYSPEARVERMLGGEGARERLIEQLRVQDRGGPAAEVPGQEAEQGPARPQAPRTRKAPSSKGRSSSGGRRRGGRGRRSDLEPDAVEGRQETAFGSGTEEPTTVGRGGSAQGLFGGTEEPTTDGQGGSAQGFVGGNEEPTTEGRGGAQRATPQPFTLRPGDDVNFTNSGLRNEIGERTAQVAREAEQLRLQDKGRGSDYEGRAARMFPREERASDRNDSARRGRGAMAPQIQRMDPTTQGNMATTDGREVFNAMKEGRDPRLIQPNADARYAAETNRMPAPQEQGQPTPQGRGAPQGQFPGQGQPFQRPLPQGSGSTVSKGNYAQPSYTPGQADASSKGSYLQGQGRDQGFPMGDAALRPDPTSAESRAARALPNGSPQQLSHLADQYRSADRTMNDRLNAQVGPDPNAGNYRAAISGMPASTLGGSIKNELKGRDLDLKERDIDRKTSQGDRRLDYLTDAATGKLNESMMRHLDQANGTNISNAIRAAKTKSDAGIPLNARDQAALDRAGDLAITPASRPNMQGVAPPVPGAAPRGVPRQNAPTAQRAPPPMPSGPGPWKLRTNTVTGEQRWFPAQ